LPCACIACWFIQHFRHNDTFLRSIASSSAASPPILPLIIAAASDPDENARKFAAFAIGNAGTLTSPPRNTV
jgi:HEAT repeat protein